MIRLNVSELQLFDIIMAVYSMGNVEGGQRPPAALRRREVLLDKLHRAFDSSVISPPAVHVGAPGRMDSGAPMPFRALVFEPTA
jgi:hypothetical protein